MPHAQYPEYRHQLRVASVDRPLNGGAVAHGFGCIAIGVQLDVTLNSLTVAEQVPNDLARLPSS